MSKSIESKEEKKYIFHNSVVNFYNNGECSSVCKDEGEKDIAPVKEFKFIKNLTSIDEINSALEAGYYSYTLNEPLYEENESVKYDPLKGNWSLLLSTSNKSACGVMIVLSIDSTDSPYNKKILQIAFNGKGSHEFITSMFVRYFDAVAEDPSIVSLNRWEPFFS